METSKSICTIAEYDDMVIYKAQCWCGSEDCHHELILGYDSDLGLSLEICTNTDFKEMWLYGPSSRFDKVKLLWKRIKVAFKILFLGRAVLSSYFMFRSEAIDDYIKALQEGLVIVRKVKKEKEGSVSRMS